MLSISLNSLESTLSHLFWMEENLTCNRHGMWEPNSGEICGTDSKVVTGSSQRYYGNTCNLNHHIYPGSYQYNNNYLSLIIYSVGSVATSTLAVLVALLLLSSLLLFIVGFFIGRFSGRKVKQTTEQLPSDSPPVLLNALYEEVVQARTDQEQEMELKLNEAYGPLRPQWQKTEWLQ